MSLGILPTLGLIVAGSYLGPEVAPENIYHSFQTAAGLLTIAAGSAAISGGLRLLPPQVQRASMFMGRVASSGFTQAAALGAMGVAFDGVLDGNIPSIIITTLAGLGAWNVHRQIQKHSKSARAALDVGPIL